jgi:hypothetical protein
LPTELLQQISVPRAVGHLYGRELPFHYKTHFPLIACHKHVSMMASTFPADHVTLNTSLGEPDSFHSMVDLLLVAVK